MRSSSPTGLEPRTLRLEVQRFTNCATSPSSFDLQVLTLDLNDVIDDKRSAQYTSSRAVGKCPLPQCPLYLAGPGDIWPATVTTISTYFRNPAPEL